MNLKNWQQLTLIEQKALLTVFKNCNVYKYCKIKVVFK